PDALEEAFTSWGHAGAGLDLAGGGQLIAHEFVPGPGGSRDVFAGGADGAFAVLPGVQGYAPFDRQIQSAVNDKGQGVGVRLGDTITFGAGGQIPAGTYAVLPARYALLEGAFLVRPRGSNVAQGHAQALADGSTLVGAALGTLGDGLDKQRAGGFVVLPSTLARRSSELRLTAADGYFETTDGTPSPTPRDAGRLAIEASQLNLAGQLKFNVA
ncbi:MAG: hypothetical protein CFE45_38810, partial [Burkholderiales bacterium PBB5]